MRLHTICARQMSSGNYHNANGVVVGQKKKLTFWWQYNEVGDQLEKQVSKLVKLRGKSELRKPFLNPWVRV